MRVAGLGLTCKRSERMMEVEASEGPCIGKVSANERERETSRDGESTRRVAPFSSFLWSLAYMSYVFEYFIQKDPATRIILQDLCLTALA